MFAFELISVEFLGKPVLLCVGSDALSMGLGSLLLFYQARRKACFQRVALSSPGLPG